MIAPGRIGAVVAALLLALLALAGCSSEYTEGTSAPAARPDTSLESARTKLRLVQQDSCYTSRDLARQWPACGRWEEEVRNVGNAAASARPDAREITDPAVAVRAGHEHFVRSGCTSTPTDPGACIAAIGETRTAVTRLAQGISSTR
ncbi:hypothetical protein [Actinomycetospora aeridis]|uniref:Uncharacterized protein n=1 Tax=Actinomycetospora aeridis TaxID=3129231 RepID=A0ABU8N681_9PSEU